MNIENVKLGDGELLDIWLTKDFVDEWDSSNKVAPDTSEKDERYWYHGSALARIKMIKQMGLIKPNKHQLSSQWAFETEDRIYYAENPALSAGFLWYSAPTSYVMLRIPRKCLDTAYTFDDIGSYDMVENGPFDGYAIKTWIDVNPEDIEIYNTDTEKWEPLLDLDWTTQTSCGKLAFLIKGGQDLFWKLIWHLHDPDAEEDE